MRALALDTSHGPAPGWSADQDGRVFGMKVWPGPMAVRSRLNGLGETATAVGRPDVYWSDALPSIPKPVMLAIPVAMIVFGKGSTQVAGVVILAGFFLLAGAMKGL